MRLRTLKLNRLRWNGPAAWLAAGLFAVAIAALSSWLSVVLRMESINGWLQGQVAPFAQWLPRGGVVRPRGQMFEDSLSHYHFSTVWEVVGSPPFVDRLLVFVLWHFGVTAVIVWMYWSKGRPSHLGQHAGASISVGSAAPQVVALSAVFSVAIGPLVYLAHSVWFALNLSLHTTGGERLATGIPLALGHAGVGGIWLGAIVAHAAIVGWCVRAVVTAAVKRNKSGLVPCASCSYALKANHIGVCPECGIEHKFTPTQFHLMTNWLYLRTSVVWAAIIVFYCAPLTLSMLGRITPHQLAEPVAHWWYRLF